MDFKEERDFHLKYLKFLSEDKNEKLDDTHQRMFDIGEYLKKLDEIGDGCEREYKNPIHGLCSIYFYNDLNHIIDYPSNGYDEQNREDFFQIWKNILDTVQNLSERRRKHILSLHLDKNHSIFFDYEVEDDGFETYFQQLGHSYQPSE